MFKTAVIVGALAACGTMGAPHILASLLLHRVHARSEAAAPPADGLRVMALRGHDGWFRGERSFDLLLPTSCAHPANGRIHVELKVAPAHAFPYFPEVDYTVTMDPRLTERFGVSRLSGRGSVGFAGFHTRMVIPAIESEIAVDATVDRPAHVGHAAFPASEAELWLGPGAMRIAWSVPRGSLHEEGRTARLEDVRMRVELEDLAIGLGEFELGAASIEGEDYVISDATLRLFGSVSGHGVDYGIALDVATSDPGERELGDVRLRIDAGGLDAGAMRELVALARASCGFERLSSVQALELRRVAAALVAEGPAQLDGSLSARVRDADQLTARGHLAVSPARGPVPIHERIELEGAIRMTTHSLSELALVEAQRLGFVRDGATLSLDVAYAGGSLRLHGEPLEETRLRAQLASTDVLLGPSSSFP